MKHSQRWKKPAKGGIKGALSGALAGASVGSLFSRAAIFAGPAGIPGIGTAAAVALGVVGAVAGGIGGAVATGMDDTPLTSNSKIRGAAQKPHIGMSRIKQIPHKK